MNSSPPIPKRPLFSPSSLPSPSSSSSLSWGIWCLEALLKRCSDLSVAIRSRALSSLAQLVGVLSNDAKASVVLKGFMGQKFTFCVRSIRGMKQLDGRLDLALTFL
ncbi:putative condensin-2 complex subunit D3-like [Sesbania bispinosa]|nr:putative condensin-2 complex subunit D3-like [Sesbania bispinosa]